MAQLKVNGSAASGQFLTARLAWFIATSGGAINVHNFGYTAGVADDGEKLVEAISSVANMVVLQTHASDTNIVYFATEVPGISAAAIQTAVQASHANLANATVVAGTVSVV